ncbi:MAG: hypothetical protein HYU66_05235, partial [Armatimonadetes bacterium]|nr:hypothetical protein [Armatimonadota bacterium]
MLAADRRRIVRDGLVTDLGYLRSLVRDDWEFTPDGPGGTAVETVPLVAFGQAPCDYRSALIAVVAGDSMSGAAEPSRYWRVGATQILVIEGDQVHRFNVLRRPGDVQRVESFAFDRLRHVFCQRQEEWSPTRLFEAKHGIRQLDFVDLGFLEALSHEAQSKLLDLVHDAHRDVAGESAADSAVTQEVNALVLAMVAGKVLRDRREDGPWQTDDGVGVWNGLRARFRLPETTLSEDRIRLAWNRVTATFHMHNVAIEDLRLVYEDAFVGPEQRRELGIHATRAELADQVVKRLPIETIPEDRRHCFEPFCGNAPFLCSAARELRRLLSPSWNANQIHDYLVQRLVGQDAEPFACLVGRLSLILADNLHGDGWQIEVGDALRGQRFAELAECAEVILCNPPFEVTADADDLLRRQVSIALRRILDVAPSMIGMVVPFSLLEGRNDGGLRRRLGERYGTIDVIGLSDRHFRMSSTEVGLVLCYERKDDDRPTMVRGADLRYREPHGTALSELRFGPPVQMSLATTGEPLAPALLAWATRQTGKVLDDIGRIDTGTEVTGSKHVLDSGTGLTFYPVARGSVPYRAPNAIHVPLTEDDARRGAGLMREMTESGREFVVVNRNALSRQGWRLAAWVLSERAVVSNDFYAIAARDGVPTAFLAAVLNGPVANAYVIDGSNKRHNKKHLLRDVPVPDNTLLDMDWLVARVTNLQVCMEDPSGSGVSEAYIAAEAARIDAAVLDAYPFDEDQKLALVSRFDGFDHPLIRGIPYSQAVAEARAHLCQDGRLTRAASAYDAL